MKRVVSIVVALAVAAIAFLGWIDRPLSVIGGGPLQRSNEAYLTKSFNKALAAFGTMSILKAGLDVIEGSEIGASFGVTANLQVGDIVQPAYDYVDIAWRTMLTGCVTLLSIRFLLQTAAILDSYLLGVTLLLLAAFLSSHWWSRRLPGLKNTIRDALSMAIVVTLALYYLLPVSVWGAAKLSHAITQPSMEEAQKGFDQTKQALFPDDQQSPNGIVAKLKDMQNRIEQIAVYLKDKTKDMVVWAITLIAGYIFDCIVFPLLIFTLLLWATRSIMKYVFQKNSESSLRDTLSQILTGREKSG